MAPFTFFEARNLSHESKHRLPGILMLIVASVLFLFPGFSAASNGSSAGLQPSQVQATASINTSRIFVGERFILTVEISAPRLQNVRRPSLPDIDGFRLLSPTPTSTSSFSVINGVSTASNGFRYTFEAEREGTFRIPPIDIELDGNTFTTNDITVSVQSRASMQQQSRQDDIYLSLELSKEDPYRGEQLTAQVVLYYKSDINVMSYQPASSWRKEGFWVERVSDDQGPRAETIIINGMQFRRAVLMNYVLFPTRSGRVTLDEYGVNVTVRPTSRFGDTSRFFDGLGRTQRSVNLRSEAIEIDVKALPLPQPPGFTGAVGQFRVTRTVDIPEVIIGEPLEIETRFSGSGNITLIDQPVFGFPEGFENFRPTEQINATTSPQGIRGSKTFTDVLIARRVGNYELTETTISWFNPARMRYESAELPAIPLTVLRDEDQEFLFVEDQRIRISPVTGLVRWKTVSETGANREFWFMLLTLLPLLLLLFAGLWKKYIDRLRTDTAFARTKRAGDRAGEHIGAANLLAGEQNYKKAYRMLHRAVTGYVSDRMNLAESGLSDAYIISMVRQKGAEQMLLSRMDTFLRRLSDISYAPGGGSANFVDDRDEATAIIKELKKVLK